MDTDSPPVAGISRRARRRGRNVAWLATAPVLFLCVFLLYPLFSILLIGFRPIAGRGLAALGALAEDANLGPLLLASTGQALLSTFFTMLIGVPAAYVFGRYDFPGKAVLRTLLTIPFVLPTIVVSAAFVELLGSGGLLPRVIALATGGDSAAYGINRTLAAVLIAHVFYNVAIVVRIVGNAWASMDPRLGEAARVLGAGRISVFTRVTGRLLFPSLAASALLVFAFCFSSFGVILVLGGPRMGTLETEIYRQAVYMFNLPAAALLSAVQLVTTAVVLFGYSRVQARLGVTQRTTPEGARKKTPSTGRGWALVLLFGIGPCVGFLVPMAALVLGSVLTSRGISPAYWQALWGNTGHSLFWVSPLLALGNSLRFSVEAMLIALLLGIPAAYLIARGQAAPAGARGLSTTLDVLFLVPLGTSAVTLGFGFIVAFNSPPLNLQGSAVLIPIAHALVGLPLVVRSLLPALRGINPRMREAARVLGAGPSAVWRRVDLPMLSRSFAAAAGFALTVSLGEFGATALLTRPSLVTLPVLIYNSLSRPGEVSQGQALALSTILMAACALGLGAIERFRSGGGELA